MREAGHRLLQTVDDLDPLVDVVSPLTPTVGLRISTKAWPKLGGRWPSTSQNVAAVTTCWAFRAVTSSSDRKKPMSTTFAAPVRLPETSSCSARGPSPTSSIRSKSGSDDTASRSNVKRWRQQIEGFVERRALTLSTLRRQRRPGSRLRGCWTRPRTRWRHLERCSIRSKRTGKKLAGQPRPRPRPPLPSHQSRRRRTLFHGGLGNFPDRPGQTR